MGDLTSIVGPTLFRGGHAADYAVEVLSNGGLGTRHLETGKMVPHVLSKVSPEAVRNGLPVPGGSGLMQVAGGAAQAAQMGLAVANLGVGLLNLGVSAWTAWKVHQMGKTLDVVADGVNRIDGKLDNLTDLVGGSVRHLDSLIRQNALMLGLVIEHQAHLEVGIHVLRAEVQHGFLSVHEALNDKEARRAARELEQQMRTLFRYYEVCSTEIQSGRTPPAADLRRIVDVATSLVAWLDSQLAEFAPGRPERLPMLVARAFALRLERDARTLLDEAPESRNQDFKVLQSLIADEIHVLTRGKDVVSVAVNNQPLVEHYVFLHRALGGPATILEFDNGLLLPMYPDDLMTWDDGLERVRVLVQSAREAPDEVHGAIELRTLAEHRSWQQLTGLPRGSTEDRIPSREVAEVLGLGEHVPAEDDLRELLGAAPSGLEALEQALKKEVG